MDEMKISVIVPAFNEEKLITSTLESIRAAGAAFTERGWAWEIVVCDNNSTDRTGELARATGAKVVFEPKNQIARARNAGAAVAAGEWFLFVDADSRPSRELFIDLIEAMASGRFLGGGCTVQLDERHFLASLFVFAWNTVSRICKWAAGSFVLCEANAFRAIGGFNEAFYASEEIDFSQRLKREVRQRGKRLVILHRHPLVTSARKIHLYSPWDYARFMAKTIATLGATTRAREGCPIWYDGRR